VGVPEIDPVVEFRVSPDGREPVAIEKVFPPLPPEEETAKA
jgi:hypothetical protein